MNFSSDDPTFQGLLASLRSAQDGQTPSTSESPQPVQGQVKRADGGQAGGLGGYQVSYAAPPVVDGVFTAFASSTTAGSYLHPSSTNPSSSSSYRPHTTSTDDEYSPLTFQPITSTTSTQLPGLSRSFIQETQRARDPFATTSTSTYQQPKDIRTLSFTQSLPYLSRLAEDEDFMRMLKHLKKDQDDLERRLISERKKIIAESKGKVEKARLKATVMGSKDLGEFEKQDAINTLTSSLASFHLYQVLPAWDSLIESQLKILEKRGVPGLGTNKVERESDSGRGRIRKVLGMLEGVMEDS